MANVNIIQNISNVSTRLLARHISTQSVKNTHVFRFVHQPERTPEHRQQRRPHEKHEFQKLELLEVEHEKPLGPLNVILLEDIEGIGMQFDSVMVDRDLARHNLIPLKKATYASPFNLQYYCGQKERMRDELDRRVRIPFDLLKLGRSLMSRTFPIFVSMDNAWTVDGSLVSLSLLQAGIEADASSIHLPTGSETLAGPNLDLEAKLLRFYVLIDDQYVVPMLGRLTHISSDDTKKNLFPEALNAFPSDEQIRRAGLRPESPYFFPSVEAAAAVSGNLFGFMTRRRDDAAVYEGPDKDEPTHPSP